MDRLRTGILAGLAAGVIMGILSLLFYQTGIFTWNPFTVMARIFMDEAAAATGTGLFVGLITHLIGAALLGVVFTFLLADRENSLYWGITYGTALYFINAGVVGPALGILPPLWQVNFPNNIAALIVRVVYGASLGYLVHLWMQGPVEQEPVPEGGGEHHG